LCGSTFYGNKKLINSLRRLEEVVESVSFIPARDTGTSSHHKIHPMGLSASSAKLKDQKLTPNGHTPIGNPAVASSALYSYSIASF
jgi:hypothetical protein